MINKQRLLDDIEALATFTDQTPGVTRLSFTQNEQKAKQYLKDQAHVSDLIVREDAVGNLYMRYEQHDDTLKTVLIGSHIDSVIHGGKYDGALGVLTGLELLRTFKANQQTLPFHLEVVAFTDEEGARFKTGMIGSRAAIGQLEKQELEATDMNGLSLEQAMVLEGYQPERMQEVQLNPDEYLAYLEVHIEQGKVLEKQALPVGVVAGIVGLRWYEITVTGEAGHAGATPMADRTDPLIAASRFMLELDEWVRTIPDAVLTFGQIKVDPGSINVIPEAVTFSVDARALDEETLIALETRIEQAMVRLEEKTGAKVKRTPLDIAPPVKMDERVMALLSSAIEQSGFKATTLPSGAGHDAMHMASVMPSGLLFVRTKDGHSHRPDETIADEDVVTAAEVLYQAVQNLDPETFS